MLKHQNFYYFLELKKWSDGLRDKNSGKRLYYPHILAQVYEPYGPKHCVGKIFGKFISFSCFSLFITIIWLPLYRRFVISNLLFFFAFTNCNDPLTILIILSQAQYNIEVWTLPQNRVLACVRTNVIVPKLPQCSAVSYHT